MIIVEEIDKNNISTNLNNMLNIKEWMKENNTTIPPRTQNKNGTVPEEEANLGEKLSYIRKSVINPYLELQAENEKKEYRRKYPEIEELMEMVDEINKNNKPTYLRNILNIKEWMKKNNTTRPPRKQTTERTILNDEAVLGESLSTIRTSLLKPYEELESIKDVETKKRKQEKYKREHLELEEVMAIVEEIDKNNIPKNLKIVREVKKWIIENNTTKKPRRQNRTKTVPKEEENLANSLKNVEDRLIKPYKKLETEELREEYKRKHPELEEVMSMVDEIYGDNKKKRTGKELAEASISSIKNPETSDEEISAFQQLNEQYREGGIITNEQS